MLDEGMSDSRSPVKKPVMEDDDDDDDDLMPATGRLRNRGSFLDDDDNSQGISRHRKGSSAGSYFNSRMLLVD